MIQTRDVWLRRFSPAAPSAPASAVRVHPLAVPALGQAAARETLLMGMPHVAAVWTNLFESLLAPPPERALRWAGKGPGIGRDARIAYSSLLGRFVARTHLVTDLKIRVLVPVDVAKGALESAGYAIRTKQTDPGYRADWIGYDDVGLVIAEAKGNHSGNTIPQGIRLPPILRPAIRQTIRTEVWKTAQVPARRIAIAARWATQRHTRQPELLVWDSKPSQTRHPEPARLAALSRADGIRVFRGMGYAAPHDLESTVSPKLHRVLFEGREFGPGYIAVADSLGVRPVVDPIAPCTFAATYLVFSEEYWAAVERGEPPHLEMMTSSRWAQAGGLSVLWPRPEGEFRFLPAR